MVNFILNKRGGIDQFYTKKFGDNVEKQVQELIKTYHDG
jgi:hypothetical protein